MAVRRIVLVRRDDRLQEGWQRRAFAPAASLLEREIRVQGVHFDDRYPPVFVPGRTFATADRPRAIGFNYENTGPVSAYSVRAEFEDENAIERLFHDRGQEVLGIFADPPIASFPPPYCNYDKPVGTEADVARKLGVDALRQAGLTGRRVRVAIVDTGIDGNRIPVEGGWGLTRDYVPGSALANHGTMVAHDVRIAAPDASILDFALLQETAPRKLETFLSDAIAAFADLLQMLTSEPGPLVINNSWGLYDRSEDLPIGSPGNYSTNLEHPFNQLVTNVIAAGADIFFAAGNCGEQCPAEICGAGDVGPGQSIHGANSHPDVITVAAVTVTDRRLGYSSQGPGGLHSRKPDLAGYSHFLGSGITANKVDGGTSAASPVAAGVAAALRQKGAGRKLNPAQMKGLLQRTARDLQRSGWDYDVGYGVVDATAAVQAISRRP